MARLQSLSHLNDVRFKAFEFLTVKCGRNLKMFKKPFKANKCNVVQTWINIT